MAKEPAKLRARGNTCLVAGDIDADGDLDVLAGSFDYDGAPQLYRNNGGGVLECDITGMPSGLLLGTVAAMALGDVDGDGDLDLVTGNNAMTIPSIYPPWIGPGCSLLLNDGAGHFTDATAPHLPGVGGFLGALVLGDVDNDGDLDIVRNGSQDQLFVNNGSGTFTAVTLAFSITNCVALGDVDGDGDLDMLCGNFGQNRLYLNDGSGNFTDVTAAQMPAARVRRLGSVITDAGERVVQDHTQRVHVGSVVDVGTLRSHLLRTHVAGSPRKFAGAGHARLVEEASQAEVDDVRPSLCVHQQVLGLDVAVPAFDALPARVRDVVYERLWRVLTGRFGQRTYQPTRTERQAILDILLATKRGLPPDWRPVEAR